MRKNHTNKSRPQNEKGRVLARELAQELRYVPGGGGIGTFTAPPDPDWPPDRD
jgi:hypothetical protein